MVNDCSVWVDMGVIIKKEEAEVWEYDWLCVSCGFLRGDRVHKTGFRKMNPRENVLLTTVRTSIRVFEISEGNLRNPYRASPAYSLYTSQNQMTISFLFTNVDSNSIGHYRPAILPLSCQYYWHRHYGHSSLSVNYK